MMYTPRDATKLSTKGKVWVDKKEYEHGHIFKKELNGISQNKEIEEIATKAASCGEDVRSFTWIKNTNRYNDPSLPRFYDPFLLRLKANNIEMDYHFGSWNFGYITRVAKESKSAMMKDKAPIPKSNSSNGEQNTYSNQHNTTGKRELMKYISMDIDSSSKRRKQEKIWDSFTKLGGEGARFLCVRKHMERLKNGSKFLHNNSNGIEYDYVTFNSLWLNWNLWNRFSGTKFNIPNDQIISKLDSMQGHRLILITKVEPNDDYSLDNDKAIEEKDIENAYKKAWICIRKHGNLFDSSKFYTIQKGEGIYITYSSLKKMWNIFDHKLDISSKEVISRLNSLPDIKHFGVEQAAWIIGENDYDLDLDVSVNSEIMDSHRKFCRNEIY